MKSFPTSKSTDRKKVYFKTFGCQMNEADSERMLALLDQDDYEATHCSDEADLIIINTCSVRDKAYHKAISAIGKHNKTGREVKIGVTGCVASQEGSAIAERFGAVDFVLGTDHINKIREAARYRRLKNGAYVATDFYDIDDYHFPSEQREREGEAPLALPVEGATQAPSDRPVTAYVTIMKGCDNTCAFCIVPFTRGPEISRAAADIIREIQELQARGVREITLLGQNVNSYGKRLADKIDFADLLHMIDKRTKIERLRFTSPHPKDLSPRLIAEYQHNPILCRHIHLPVQSGSTRVLKRMRRAHTRETYLRRVEAMRQACPNVAITTVLIVGFPGVSDADFQDTLGLMLEVDFHASKSFAYSESPGTEAATFEDDVPTAVNAERLQELQTLQNRLSTRKNQLLVQVSVPILVEGPSKTGSQYMGRTSSHKIVNFNGCDEDIGAIVNVGITRATAHALYGEKDHGQACQAP